jgi:hypothetical protein
MAGQPNRLNLSSGDPNTALDGAMLHAKTPEIKRVGSFFNPSGILHAFPAGGTQWSGQARQSGPSSGHYIQCESPCTTYLVARATFGSYYAGFSSLWQLECDDKVEGVTKDADNCAVAMSIQNIIRWPRIMSVINCLCKTRAVSHGHTHIYICTPEDQERRILDELFFAQRYSELDFYLVVQALYLQQARMASSLNTGSQSRTSIRLSG